MFFELNIAAPPTMGFANDGLANPAANAMMAVALKSLMVFMKILSSVPPPASASPRHRAASGLLTGEGMHRMQSYFIH
jgi:hypothetical protein